MNDEEKVVLKLASKLGVHSSNAESVQAILSLAQAIRDQEAAKHNAEVAELERKVAGLRDAAKRILDRLISGDQILNGPNDTDADFERLEDVVIDTAETAKRYDARVLREAAYIVEMTSEESMCKRAAEKLRAKADELGGKK